MPQHWSFTTREGFPRMDFSSVVQRGAPKEGTGCPLPLSSGLLNLLSPHAEVQIAPQCLGVTSSLFRQHHCGVRFVWDHPSLISTSSFLPDGMPVPGWKFVLGPGMLMSSLLRVFCLHPMLAIHILAPSARLCPSLCCLRPYTTGMKRLVLPYWAAIWRENRYFSTAG